jgi:hypothetical protein
MCVVDWAMLLEYLKVLFSWPPMLAGVLIWFIQKYNTQISNLLIKIKGIELPNGTKVVLAEIEQKQDTATTPEISLIEGEQGAVNAGPQQAEPPFAGTAGEVNRTVTLRVVELYPDIVPATLMDFMEKNPGPALSDYVDKVFQLHCERTYNIIFGTQIDVLSYLESVKIAGPAPISALVEMFNRHQALTQRTDRSMSDFLDFLEIKTFIHKVGIEGSTHYEITVAGTEFLAHIKANYPERWDKVRF